MNGPEREAIVHASDTIRAALEGATLAELRALADRMDLDAANRSRREIESKIRRKLVAP